MDTLQTIFNVSKLSEKNITKVLLYTRDDTLKNEYRKIYNEDTYYEIIFDNDDTLCLWGYMKYTSEDKRKAQDINEFLNGICINDINASETLENLSLWKTPEYTGEDFPEFDL